jgi:hypothetical protein
VFARAVPGATARIGETPAARLPKQACPKLAIVPRVDESGASLSSHTRKQFHTANRSDSGSHRRQRVAKRTDVRNLFRKAAPKISSSDLLIADSSIIDGADKSGWQFDLTTAIEHFQITNVHRTDSYGLRAVAILHE